MIYLRNLTGEVNTAGMKRVAFFCARAMLLTVICTVVLTAKAEWPEPPRVEEWSDFDDVVAERYNSLTNDAPDIVDMEQWSKRLILSARPPT